MKSLKWSLKSLDSQNNQGVQEGKQLRNQRQHFCLPRNLPNEGKFAYRYEWNEIDMYQSSCKHNIFSKFFLLKAYIHIKESSFHKSNTRQIEKS